MNHKINKALIRWGTQSRSLDDWKAHCVHGRNDYTGDLLQVGAGHIYLYTFMYQANRITKRFMSDPAALCLFLYHPRFREYNADKSNWSMLKYKDGLAHES